MRSRAALCGASIAPSTYFTHKARERDPPQCSARAQRDAALRPEIQRMRFYGALKGWKQLNPEGIFVARCTVEQLMRVMGLGGAVRGRAFKATTIPDELAERPIDLDERQFTAIRPNDLFL